MLNYMKDAQVKDRFMSLVLKWNGNHCWGSCSERVSSCKKLHQDELNGSEQEAGEFSPDWAVQPEENTAHTVITGEKSQEQEGETVQSLTEPRQTGPVQSRGEPLSTQHTGTSSGS